HVAIDIDIAQELQQQHGHQEGDSGEGALVPLHQDKQQDHLTDQEQPEPEAADDEDLEPVHAPPPSSPGADHYSLYGQQSAQGAPVTPRSQARAYEGEQES